jgi:hypothetical protein
VIGNGNLQPPGNFRRPSALVKGNGHSAEGLSRYVVVNAKVLLDRAECFDDLGRVLIHC